MESLVTQEAREKQLGLWNFPELVESRLPLECSPAASAYCGLISNLALNARTDQLSAVAAETLEHLKYCSEDQQLATECKKLTGVLHQLAGCIKQSPLPEFPSDEQLAKAFNQSSEYLTWIFSQRTVSDVLKYLAGKYEKTFEIFKVEGNQMKRTVFKSSDQKMKGVLDVIQIFNTDKGNFILYEGNHRMRDLVYKLIHEQQLVHSKMKISEARVQELGVLNYELQRRLKESLGSQLQSNNQNKRKEFNISMLNWKIQRLEAEIHQLRNRPQEVVIQNRSTSAVGTENDKLKRSASQRTLQITHRKRRDNPEVPQCSLCLQRPARSSVFNCAHTTCEECLGKLLSFELKNRGGCTGCPFEGCQHKINAQKLVAFCRDIRQSEGLLQHFNQRSIVSGLALPPNEKVMACSKCREQFSVPKDSQYFRHCGVQTCIQCGQHHPDSALCGDSLKVLRSMQLPCICPDCFSIFEKDDGCEHVDCPFCKHNPDVKLYRGFCAQCSASRKSILVHDNSYHRTDCPFYCPNSQLEYKPEACEDCRSKGSLCDRPTESFQSMVRKRFGSKFFDLFQHKRTESSKT